MTRTRTRRIFNGGAFAAMLLAGFGATAQMTNGLSNAEIHGRQLAKKLLEIRPTESFTNTGVLQIRDRVKKRPAVPLICITIVTATDWRSVYKVDLTNQTVMLFVIHAIGQSNIYFCKTNASEQVPLLGDIPVLGHFFGGSQISGRELMSPFAASDFWICDLGLEFLHWSGQKILRGDTARGRLCEVLESTNPEPSTNAYSHVLSWIDKENDGIIQAEAYDVKGKKLKEFYPKDIKKNVDGQWQVGSMEIDNVQTKSRTWLVFDLKAKQP